MNFARLRSLVKFVKDGIVSTHMIMTIRHLMTINVDKSTMMLHGVTPEILIKDGKNVNVNKNLGRVFKLELWIIFFDLSKFSKNWLSEQVINSVSIRKHLLVVQNYKKFGNKIQLGFGLVLKFLIFKNLPLLKKTYRNTLWRPPLKCKFMTS